MVYRLFVDLETTGPGQNKYSDILDIHAVLYVNGSQSKEFSAKYSYTNQTVFTGGMNWYKAQKHKEENRKSSKEGLVDFIGWLNTNLGKNKAFLVSYNCAHDLAHLKN